MPAVKRKPKPRDGAGKLRPDVNEIAFRVIQEATGQADKTLPPEERTEKNAEAVKRGQKGGKKGGPARAAKLTEDARARSATIAALARWKKTP